MTPKKIADRLQCRHACMTWHVHKIDTNAHTRTPHAYMHNVAPTQNRHKCTSYMTCIHAWHCTCTNRHMCTHTQHAQHCTFTKYVYIFAYIHVHHSHIHAPTHPLTRTPTYPPTHTYTHLPTHSHLHHTHTCTHLPTLQYIVKLICTAVIPLLMVCIANCILITGPTCWTNHSGFLNHFSSIWPFKCWGLRPIEWVSIDPVAVKNVPWVSHKWVSIICQVWDVVTWKSPTCSYTMVPELPWYLLVHSLGTVGPLGLIGALGAICAQVATVG